MRDASARHRRIRAIFDEALLHHPSARDAYLDRTCAADLELRSDIVRLLTAHAGAESFLERPTWRPLLSPIGDDDGFRGTPRFAVRRRLGMGGMGVVYEVDDNARGEIVALKTLRRITAVDIYRLKREFRSLADVVHRNLVSLHELFADDDQCFFTMELVPGENFVDYVRGTGEAGRSDERVVSAVRQLVEGISILHRTGKLHRDIKPSNVLVTPDSRVVILDFGLVTELAPRNAYEDASRGIGTPPYMPPEAASAVGPTEAADWYAVGVTLFEALTGRLPFVETGSDFVRRDRQFEAPSFTDADANVPSHLRAICGGLLQRDPDRRFTGQEVLRRLGRDPQAMRIIDTFPPHDSPFVGRARELMTLQQTFERVTRGEPAAMCVSGPSGIGKSALVRCFLAQLAVHPGVVVLSGRCYEHESVPYKALDAVVDSLSRYLGSIAHADVAALLPAHVSALSRLFPVLRQVDAVVGAVGREKPGALEPHLLREQGFAALRDLLAVMADKTPLVIAIDDVHWADLDSTALLEELLRPPHAPAIFVLVCARSEETANPVLQRLFRETVPQRWTALPLGPMGEGDAQALIEACSRGNKLSGERAVEIARAADGNPFFLEQLTQYRSRYGDQGDESASFARMLEARIRELPDGARPFLETLALCARPETPELVFEAASVASDGRRLEALLRAARLTRSSGSSGRIEPYHDRIRETLTAQLPANAVRHIHRRLAEALAARQIDDPEALFAHCRGAGDHESAARHAIAAAQKAMAALAFDRAAWLYQQALGLTAISPPPSVWQVAQADALACSGRPAEAAEAYVRAADASEPAQRLDLQRRGAEQFLIGGHIDQGMTVLRGVLREVGIGLPRSPLTAVSSFLWHRVRLRWRGLEIVERNASRVAADDLLRIDIHWSVVTGLGMVDTMRAAVFSARFLRLALDAGEPTRLVRALAIEAMFAASRGQSHRNGAVALVARARAIAERLGQPQPMALCSIASSMAAFFDGRWQQARAHSMQAQELVRDRAGVMWELDTAHTLVIWSLMYLGELAEVARQLPPLLTRAVDRGNLALATELRTRMNIFWLAADDPDEGERQVRDSLAVWSQTGFHRQHYSGMLVNAQTELYRGDAEGAWRRITAHWPLVRRSQLLRIQLVRIEAWFLRARSALAVAARRKDNRRFLSQARHDARRIAAEGMPWSNPHALLLSAGVALLEGDAALAQHRLSRAVDGYVDADMDFYAAVARRRLAALQQGPQRDETERQSNEWMQAQRVKNPSSFTRAFVCGFPDET